MGVKLNVCKGLIEDYAVYDINEVWSWIFLAAVIVAFS